MEDQEDKLIDITNMCSISICDDGIEISHNGHWICDIDTEGLVNISPLLVYPAQTTGIYTIENKPFKILMLSEKEDDESII